MRTKLHLSELYAKALDLTPANEFQQRNENDLLANFAKLIPIDVAEQQHKEAKSYLDQLSRPGATEPAGQLNFDWGTCNYEPRRVLRCDGMVVDQEFASYKFKVAEAERARENAQAVTAQADEKQRETLAFGAWIVNEASTGRPQLELNFGNWVREANILDEEVVSPPRKKPGSVPPPEERRGVSGTD